jgi:hypothetical protein
VPPSHISASASIAVPLFHIWPVHSIAHRPFNIPAGASNRPSPITPFIFRLAHSIAHCPFYYSDAISYCMPRCPLPFSFGKRIRSLRRSFNLWLTHSTRSN